MYKKNQHLCPRVRSIPVHFNDNGKWKFMVKGTLKEKRNEVLIVLLLSTKEVKLRGESEEENKNVKLKYTLWTMRHFND